jgi:hypothetical protein
MKNGSLNLWRHVFNVPNYRMLHHVRALATCRHNTFE